MALCRALCRVEDYSCGEISVEVKRIGGLDDLPVI
jgi:hypothetical protein